MSEAFDAKILVIPPGGTGLIADVAPEQFRPPDVDKIAQITNQIVVQLQTNLLPAAQAEGRLALSEIELMFGIDFEAEAGGEFKIPLIGPAIRGGVKGGATFEVHIKLSRENTE